jgi:hypothetical protein
MADVSNRPVEKVYAELLYKRYTKGSNKVHQTACRKFWDSLDEEVDASLI